MSWWAQQIEELREWLRRERWARQEAARRQQWLDRQDDNSIEEYKEQREGRGHSMSHETRQREEMLEQLRRAQAELEEAARRRQWADRQDDGRIEEYKRRRGRGR